MFCKFCNKDLPESHIIKCKFCGLKAHVLNGLATCECCGKKFDHALETVKPVVPAYVAPEPELSEPAVDEMDYVEPVEEKPYQFNRKK